jgi:hypothetical protein
MENTLPQGEGFPAFETGHRQPFGELVKSNGANDNKKPIKHRNLLI